MNRTWRVKVDENAPHSVVGVAAIAVVDVTDVGQEEEEASHYRVYYHKENAVEEVVVGYDREIVHVSLVNDYSCKRYLHKEIVVVVDDVVVAADAAVAVAAAGVVAVVEEEQFDGDAAAAAVDGDAAAVAHKDE